MENFYSLTIDQQKEILTILKTRFEKNMNRHKGMDWKIISEKFTSPIGLEKLWSLYEMEKTGGEPDVIGMNESTGEYIFCDCSAESPSGRRSICYDLEGQQSRKENQPKNNAIDMAQTMGIEILSEHEYRELQKLGTFDSKTSSWIKTPIEIRKLNGAIFADFRYGNVFVYHNRAQSYYSNRAFRGKLML